MALKQDIRDGNPQFYTPQCGSVGPTGKCVGTSRSKLYLILVKMLHLLFCSTTTTFRGTEATTTMPISRLNTSVLTPAVQFFLQALGPLLLEQRPEADPARLETQVRAVGPNLVLWPFSSERSSFCSPDWRLYSCPNLMIKNSVYEYIPHPTFYF